MSPETEPEAQLRLFPLDPPKRIKGQQRVVPTYSDEQRAAFRRTEEVIAGIRPSSLPGNRKLCAGCGKEAVRAERVESTSWPGLSLSASVPHCGACREGAAYGQTEQLTASVTESKRSICLKVKSHRFYHAAMTANSALYRAAR